MKQLQVFDREILIAQTAGFCMGVKRGVQMAIKGRYPHGEKRYTLGPLVHNDQVIEVLESLGIRCLDKEDVEKDRFERGEILIRAHGVPPDYIDFLKEKGLSIRDATCPHVTRAQRIAARYSQKGYYCIIFGDDGHSEVKGILGYTRGRGFASTDPESVKKLGLDSQTPLCILSQTTQETSQFRHFVSEIKKFFPRVEVQNTICNATEERQNELKKLVEEVDMLIILGGKHSGNTRRLYEIGSERLSQTIWVEAPSELDKYKDSIRKAKKIGVSAGASTPQWIIDAVQEKVGKIIIHEKNFLLGSLYDFLRCIIRLSLLVGLAAGFSGLFWSSFFNSPYPLRLFFMTVLYVFSMYFGHRLKEIEYKDPSRFKMYRQHEGLFWSLLFFLLIVGTLTGFLVSPLSGIVYGVLALVGMLYIFPQQSFFLKRLHVIPGSKDFAVALAWAFLAVVFPAKSGVPETFLLVVPIAFAFMATAVFFRMLLLDLLDFQSDRIMGRDTLITMVSQKKYRKLLHLIWFVNLVCLVFLVPLIREWTLLLLLLNAGLLGTRILVDVRPTINRYLFETLLDGLFVVPALIGLLL